MTDLAMPKLSDSMEEGTILSWLKADGDHVEAGEDLVEIETDKSTITHPAEASGVLTIVASEGTSLPVGATIARVGLVSEAAVDEPVVPAPSNGDRTPASTGRPMTDSGVAVPASAAAPVAAAGAAKATPLARRIAMTHAVPLAYVAGTGPLGRVTRADVLRAAGIEEAPPAPAAPEPAVATPAPGPAASGVKGDAQVVEPTRLQAVVARRMAEAKATVPDFQVQTEAVMDAAIALRARLKASGAELVPSFNDFVVKASAIALRRHPRANGAYRDGRFELYSRVNVGIAVAAEGALVVPTIFDADEKSLGAIAADAGRLAAAVRGGSVTPPALAGATFTVSNLGMYGMTAISPVINTPQAAILGVGALRETLARGGDGEIVDRTLMTLTLSCDHRILYGAEAAELLSDIRELLETPIKLAL